MSPSVTAALALASAALAQPAAAACDFRYPSATSAVLSAVSQIGESAEAWDLDKPTVSFNDRKVKLIFQLRNQEGRLDCPYLVVRIADCGRGKPRARVEAWDVALRRD